MGDLESRVSFFGPEDAINFLRYDVIGNSQNRIFIVRKSLIGLCFHRRR